MEKIYRIKSDLTFIREWQGGTLELSDNQFEDYFFEIYGIEVEYDDFKWYRVTPKGRRAMTKNDHEILHWLMCVWCAIKDVASGYYVEFDFDRSGLINRYSYQECGLPHTDIFPNAIYDGPHPDETKCVPVCMCTEFDECEQSLPDACELCIDPTYKLLLDHPDIQQGIIVRPW